MRTASVFGVIAVILTLVNLTVMLAVAAATGMDPRTRLMMLALHLVGVALFATLSALLLKRASV